MALSMNSVFSFFEVYVGFWLASYCLTLFLFSHAPVAFPRGLKYSAAFAAAQFSHVWIWCLYFGLLRDVWV